MVLPPITAPKSPLSEHFEKRKFTRRDDISTIMRLSIASDALYARLNGVHGTITDLARQYDLSRTFIYSLASTLKEAGQFLFDTVTPSPCGPLLRMQTIEAIFSLRLEGRSSTNAISTIVKRFGFKHCSVGFISQILSRVGKLLPMTLSTKEDVIQYVVFASDEIFSKNTPILITVDPCSSAILRIELAESRTGEDWKNHFECIFDNGFGAIYLVSDDGQGLCSGHKEAMSDRVRQSDTYHGIAHQLGKWVELLETSAYKAIKHEYECENKFDSAKSEKVQKKRWEAYVQATKDAEKAVELYDDFRYLYHCLHSQLNIFDANGDLRDKQQAIDSIKTALTLIEGLDHTKITTLVNKVRRALPDLFHYFDVAAGIISECKELPVNEDSLKAYCLAWQWGKAVIKAKKPDRKKAAKQQEQEHLEIAACLQQQELSDMQGLIYSKLDTIVQSSALVECINSIIRPYLNTTKNHVTQELLNLIMHYHNHRRYRHGKRKNKTPMELLTGKDQTEDWISILFGIIREKDPKLLLAS